MKQALWGLLISIALLIAATPAYASSQTVSLASATLSATTLAVVDTRTDQLEHYLADHESPLTGYSGFIVETADRYDIPWTLVPAIAGAESTFCKRIPFNSYNCWGWRNGEHAFESYEDAIEVVSRTLRERYFNKGRTTPELISPVYAPPSTTWAGKIRFFTSAIENHTPDITALHITI